MTYRIYKIKVEYCYECPAKCFDKESLSLSYYCKLKERRINDTTEMPDWCPLEKSKK